MSETNTATPPAVFSVAMRRPRPPEPPRAPYRNEQEWERARTGPDWLWVPDHQRAELAKRISSSLERGNTDDIEAAFAAGVSAVRARGDEQRMNAAISRYRTPHDIINTIERQFSYRLRLADNGAIECIGGRPESGQDQIIWALRGHAAAVREILRARQQIFVLVGALA